MESVQTVVCPTCTTEMPLEARYCPSCGEIRTKYQAILGRAASLSSQRYDTLAEQFRNGEPLPLDTRTAILQDEIQHRVAESYRALSQTPTAAQLQQPKQFSCLLAAALFIFTAGIGVIAYLIWLTMPGKAVYMTVDDWGEIHTI